MDTGNQQSAIRPLDVVTACRGADINVLCFTIAKLRSLAHIERVYVITAGRHFAKFRNKLGGDIQLLDEDAEILGMTLSGLKGLSLPGFPQGAGWYFQQLLKLSFAFHETADDYYLIWDADTVPLRPLRFFDKSDRMLLTTADEEHFPYFKTYRKLLDEEPRREFSFIAQHMVAQKSVVREMLSKIDANFPGTESWAWKIMRNLEGSSTNLFSEYEMLGHYMKNHYPERVASRPLRWLREGALETRGLPTVAELDRLAQRYDFVAFESAQRPLRRFVRAIRARLRH